MTSFSSVGYGDVTGQTSYEYLYQMLIEMLGIGIFGYMTGLIQTIFVGLGVKDQVEENRENIDLWLIGLDKAKPSKLLNKKVFEDVRHFFGARFINEVSFFTETEMFG